MKSPHRPTKTGARQAKGTRQERNAPWSARDLSPPSLKRVVAQSLRGKHGAVATALLRDKSRKPRREQVPAVHGFAGVYLLATAEAADYFSKRGG